MDRCDREQSTCLLNRHSTDWRQGGGAGIWTIHSQHPALDLFMLNLGYFEILWISCRLVSQPALRDAQLFCCC